jgi:hypothetical protein
LDKLIIAENLDYFNQYALEDVYSSPSEIWLFSDIFAEYDDLEVAKDTASFIVDRNFKFKYFVPAGDKHWEIVFHNIKKQLSLIVEDEKKAKALLKKGIEFYELGGVFLSRLAVVNPSDQVLCFTNIAGASKKDRKYIRIDNKNMIRLIPDLKYLIYKSSESSNGTASIEDKKLHIKNLLQKEI